uniref:Uncharacterized protein n=1 Tax=viral metagenome TaxID=1070528 RepID=A0A6M3L1X1_9ZZZZ
MDVINQYISIVPEKVANDKSKRKKCQICGNYLLSFQGKWLHPETICSGITDSIKIDVQIIDSELQDIFEGIYGNPIISDYELLNEIYEEYVKDKELLNKINSNKFLNWLVKVMIR